MTDDLGLPLAFITRFIEVSEFCFELLKMIAKTLYSTFLQTDNLQNDHARSI